MSRGNLGAHCDQVRNRADPKKKILMVGKNTDDRFDREPADLRGRVDG